MEKPALLRYNWLQVSVGPWDRIWLRAVVVLIVATLGLFFWQAADGLLALSGMMMATFALGRMPRRFGYGLFSVFYLAESSSLVSAGSAIMGTDLRISAMWWLLHGLASSLPILLLRGRAPWFRAALVALLYMVPPFGLLVPNNPSTLIGLFFPGTSIFGAIGFIALAGVIGGFDVNRKIYLRGLAILAAVSLASNAMALVSKNTVPSNWHALNTVVGNHGGDLRRRMDIGNLKLPALLKNELAQNAGEHKGEIWFFGEGMIYDWSPITDFFWGQALKGSGVTAIVGGYEFHQKTNDLTSRVYVLGDVTSNAKVKLSLDGARAGMTFPLAMWRPWGRPNHFPMYLPGPPLPIDGKRVHMSWCYESNLVWPHLLASMQAPDVMVSLENRWATKETSLEAAQEVAGRLNARWLGVPILQAINR